MEARHFVIAFFLALGAAQSAIADEMKMPEGQPDAQQAPVAPIKQETAESSQAHQDKPALKSETEAPQTAQGAVTSMPAASPVAPAKPESAAFPAMQTMNWVESFLLEVKVTDALLALFTGLLVVLSWIQARRMRETANAATNSAAVAQKSARVAEEALISGQRAFMFIREIKTVLHQDPETGKFQWTIHPIWANSGNTPTRGLSINTTYRLLDEPLPPNYDFPESREGLIPAIAGPRSMVEAAPGTLSGEELQAIQSGKKFLYIWGWAEYHDIFEGTKKRVTRFCNQLIQVDGDPTMPASEHNPIQMMFGFHTENNYAD